MKCSNEPIVIEIKFIQQLFLCNLAEDTKFGWGGKMPTAVKKLTFQVSYYLTLVRGTKLPAKIKRAVKFTCGRQSKVHSSRTRLQPSGSVIQINRK